MSAPSPEQRVGKRAEQKRRWDRENNHGVCEMCGARTWRRATRCSAHRPQNLPNTALREQVQRLWLAGTSLREIRAATGLSKGHLASLMFNMRTEGWNLPYRYNVQSSRRVAA